MGRNYYNDPQMTQAERERQWAYDDKMQNRAVKDKRMQGQLAMLANIINSGGYRNDRDPEDFWEQLGTGGLPANATPRKYSIANVMNNSDVIEKHHNYSDKEKAANMRVRQAMADAYSLPEKRDPSVVPFNPKGYTDARDQKAIEALRHYLGVDENTARRAVLYNDQWS